jgi:hypothetical protein
MGATGFFFRRGEPVAYEVNAFFKGRYQLSKGKGHPKKFAYKLKFELNTLQKPRYMNNKKIFSIFIINI